MKLSALLASGLVALGVVLGTSAAQAQPIVKVAAEGDTLPDDTILMDILFNLGSQHGGGAHVFFPI